MKTFLRQSLHAASLTVVALALCGCAQREPKFVVGISQCSDDEWRRQQNVEMQQEALIQQGLALDIKTVVDDTKKQIADIQDFIRRRVNIIIISPNQAEPITPIVEQAFDAGIPVILVDRKISSEKYTAFIGADNVQIGRDAGAYIANLLGRRGRVVEIEGLYGSTPAEERHRGFAEVIREYPQIEVVAQADGAWQRRQAAEAMQGILAAHPNVDLVFAHNDRMAAGAYATAQAMHRTGIRYVGIDALPGRGNGVEAVLAGELTATFIYPTGGDKIIQLAKNILTGAPYERNNLLYSAVVDRNNARTMNLQYQQISEGAAKVALLGERIGYYASQRAMHLRWIVAINLVAALLVVLLVFIWLSNRSRKRLILHLSEQKSLLEQQRDQLVEMSKQLEEATQAKLVFFTNISHEFRTPLTLIAGPVSTMLADESITPANRQLLLLIYKNVGTLLKLIDQIIDFRKYENGKLKLQLQQADIRQQFTEWNEMFREIAKRKQIRFTYSVPAEGDYCMVYDPEKFERIYFNLLSNAVKFTPQKGAVNVTLTQVAADAGEQIVLRVSNTGAPISDAEMGHIFERFYQVDTRTGGSGIGLALAKALAELHGGTLGAASADGEVAFTLTMPVRREAETQVQPRMEHTGLLAELPEKMVALVDNAYDNETETGGGAADTLFDDEPCDGKETVLVVDDNPDIRAFIKSVLQPDYNVLEAKDGQDGFRKAMRHIPDLVLSDVMMPAPNGIELCRMLKAELSTSHIPVILLTAYALDNHRVEGYDSGADDYVAKPFSSDVLLARIRNLLRERRRLREHFMPGSMAIDAKETVKSVDTQFVDKVKALVEARLDDSELSVDDIGAQVGLSRTQLYRKLKALTGYSTNELVRMVRLNKAKVLLGSSENNVAEVAYDTGFTSPAYFTKCFKDYFGESPSDYIKRVRG